MIPMSPSLRGALAALVALPLSAQEKPGVVWWSAPVVSGELVQVHGGAWGTNPVVEVAALPDRRAGSPRLPDEAGFGKAVRVRPVKVTETGLCFERPRDDGGWQAVCRIVSETGTASDPFVLNEPAVWWVTGDRGDEASPGGTLRFFGRCLSQAGRARVVLAAGSRRVELALTKRDTWSLDAQLPDDLPPGGYEAFIHNGGGGGDGWRSAGTVTVRAVGTAWKTDRFDVTAYGAIASDGMDDTLALQAALAAAATNGGGIVWLPRGRFQCNGTLRLPPRTLLRGAARELTELYWPDAEEPPEILIEGSTAFGLEELFIHAGKYRNGIVCTNAAAGAHALGDGGAAADGRARDITIRRVRLKLVIDQYLLKNTAEYEKRAYLKGNGLVIRDARNVRVEDCDLYASKEGSTTLYFILSAEHLRIANCRINGSGWAVVGGDKVIFENNEAWNCTYSIAPVCRNLFWSGNRQYDLFTNNRESITHDGARTAFPGLVGARCADTRVDLDFGGAKNPFRFGPDYWVGRDLQIVDGRGAGQTRTIAAITNDTVTIDRPWTVAPDASSRFVVASERRHLLYVDNYTEDASIAIQLYGGATEAVLARNRSARAGGFRGFGMDYRGIIPLWFAQYLDNRIEEGNGYRGPANEVPPRDSTVALRDHGRSNALTRSSVIRRAVLANNARIEMECANGVVEGCVVNEAAQGIVVAPRHAATVVLRGNRFERVEEPLDPVAMQQATLHPAERALAMVAGAEAVLGAAAPAAWRDSKARLEELAASSAFADPEAARASRALLAGAVRALAAEARGPLDARVARSLLGASVRVPDWDGGMTRLITSDDAETATVALRASLSPVAPAAACQIAFNAQPGWTFHAGPVDLPPGETVAIKAAIGAPAGAKGFFRLPATIAYRGDGWSLVFRDQLETLTENRITQWIVAGPFACATNVPFDARRVVREDPIDLKGAYETAAGRRGWQLLTNANVHGAVNLAAVLGAETTGTAAVAVSALRVARPVTLRLAPHGDAQLFMDGRRLGADTSRGNWGSVSLAPGLHVLKAVTFAPDKSPDWSLRVACETAGTCGPGDFVFLRATDLLQMDRLAPAVEAEGP